ncbi:MAG: protein kinase [Parachlamydiaceae bacterium]|nr:protein kinase [Parachlamydiaceae bacterium]
MKIHSGVVRFNIVHKGDVFRVGIKIKDFAANETLIKTQLEFVNQMPNAYPKALQKKIDKMIPKLPTPGKEYKDTYLNDSKSSDFQGINESKLNLLKSFYNENKHLFKRDKLAFISRADHLLPRSLVNIPNGPNRGVYVLEKQHGGATQFGLGSYNRVTMAVNLLTGEQKAWKSAPIKGVGKNEISANKKAYKYPEHFVAADNFVKYQSNIRPDKYLRANKVGPHTKEKKVGSIIDIACGGSLVKYIENNFPSFEIRLYICVEICKHLDVLHKTLELIHKDLKEDNILMTEDGQPRIMDFGFTVPNGKLDPWCGSPLYMAPELYRNDLKGRRTIADPKADIWSLGIILMQFLGNSLTWSNSFRSVDELSAELGNKYNETKIESIKNDAFDEIQQKLQDERCDQQTIDDLINVINECLQFSHIERRNNALDIGVWLAKIARGEKL